MLRRDRSTLSALGNHLSLRLNVIVVDWSANNTPKTGADSIWYCYGGVTRNPSTRHQAMREITALAQSLDGRTLIGFDLPLGFAGFEIPWRLIDELIVDGEDNSNNRFAVAAELNRRLTGGPAPFWGCPPNHAGQYLTTTKPLVALPARATEQRGAKPPWKLAYPGTCGSQSLTGIPHVMRLREALGDCSVWPFEPPTNRFVIAEVYPSMLPLSPLEGEVKDQAQVRTLEAHLREPGVLDGYLAAALPESAYREGWILGLDGVK